MTSADTSTEKKSVRIDCNSLREWECISFITFFFWNTRNRFPNFGKLFPVKSFLNCEKIISAMKNETLQKYLHDLQRDG